MTAASLLIPKFSARYLLDTYPLELALKRMKEYGYSAVPVIDKAGRYVSTVSEGDFLWYILENKDLNNATLHDIITKEKNPPARITATDDELFDTALEQNFIPIIDDRGYFMGLVTRRKILKHVNDKAALGGNAVVTA